ncbi:integrase core domain-containing protein [Streptomyces acidicola]|uniref:hypothetical protein n=1 Tax=Streptomyces acidicola TaxID=2596892 RepID=UPI003812119B
MKYEHLYRVTIGDGNALAVEADLFRHAYNTLRPHRALGERRVTFGGRRPGVPRTERPTFARTGRTAKVPVKL